MNIPKPFIIVAIVAATLALIPPSIIAWARAVNSTEPRVHLIQDMDNQPKYRAQHANLLFRDGRAMRPQVNGTIARGRLDEDEHFTKGIVKGKWAVTYPERVAVTPKLLERGQERFNIYCQPCHGIAGFGDGMINKRAMELLALGINGTSWVAPKSLHEPQIRDQPVGQIFNNITNGVRNMPAYGPQIPVADRWAIVAYVRALQRSQNAKPGDLTAQERAASQEGRR